MRKKWTKILGVTLSIVMVTTSLTGFIPSDAKAAEETVQKEFYVSVDGDDKNDGSQEYPFATIERARQEVDKINGNMSGDIIVNIGAGDYYQDEPIVFEPGDSGTNGYEIIYRASGEPGSARIIGGEKVTGNWEPVDENDISAGLSSDMIGKVYKIELGDGAKDFNTLYVDGRRATMARIPNREESTRFQTARDSYWLASGAEKYGIQFRSEDIPSRYLEAIQAAIERGEEGCQVLGWDLPWNNWFTSTIPVSGIEGNMLKFTQDPENPAANHPKYQFGNGTRYFLQGNLSFIDVPEEYHYNKNTHTLYYFPNEGEQLSEKEIIIPQTQEIFRLEGNEKESYSSAPELKDMVHNIMFRGLEVGYTEFTNSYSSGWNAFDLNGVEVFPKEALQDGITQPSYCEQRERVEFRKGVITLHQTSHITMDSMRIVNAGLMGVDVSEDNDHMNISNTEIAYVGIHGINIDGGYPGPNTGAYNSNHLVTNNVIHDIAELAGQGTGIQALQTHDNEFSHMEIYNSSRRAIFLMGAWANRVDEDKEFNRYRDTHTYDNKFEYLFMHDLQQEGGDDGAIFCSTLYGSWGDTTGSRPNYFNQIYMDSVGSTPSNQDYNPNCVNLDMGCQGLEIRNFKAVNPQQFTVRYDGGDGVKFENINLLHIYDGSNMYNSNFDESKMEYDQIGVNEVFPYPSAITTQIGKKDKTDEEYKKLYYREQFDNGTKDWWSLIGKTPVTKHYYSDNDDMIGQSFLADTYYSGSSEGSVIAKPFGHELEKIVEIDFFDRGALGRAYYGFTQSMNSFARVDDQKLQRAIGVDTSFNYYYYSYKIGSIKKVTDVKREYGWHTFKWDYTGEDVKMYIDDKLIATVAGESFNYIEMGEYSSSGFSAYDNVVIYDGKSAEEPIPLPQLPEKEGKKLPGILQAEEANRRPGTTRILNILGGKALGYIGAGDEIVFDIEVTEDFELPFKVRYASNSANANFALYIDGEKVTDVVLDNPQGWDIYQEKEFSPIAMTAGTHTIMVKVGTDNNFNLDYLSFDTAEEPEKPVMVTEIEPIVEGNLKISVGDTIKVPVIVTPEDAEDKSLTWSTSDDGNVLTVGQDGTITAIGEGTAEITITSNADSKVTVSFVIEVENAEASLISMKEKGCTASANVLPDHEKYPPEKLIDGRLYDNAEHGGDASGWCALGATKPGGRWDPSAYLEWDTPQTVKAIYLYDLAEMNNYVTKMEIIFNDDLSSKVVLENGVPDGGMEKVVLDEEKKDITKIEFHILEASAPYNNYGFEEIKVYSEISEEIPVNSISFGRKGIGMFPGNSYQLNLPEVVPSSAGQKTVVLTLEEGQDIVSLDEYVYNGRVEYYIVKALKTGTAVLRGTAENGVYNDFIIRVGDKEELENKIMEAEFLYAKYFGESSIHKEFRSVIDEAVEVYNYSNNMNDCVDILQKLEKSIEIFKEEMEDVSNVERILLQKTYDYALTLKTDAVVDSAKAFFEKALTNAEAVLNNEAATQDEVNAAWNQLLESIWGLGIVKGDTSMLEILIGRADAMNAEQDRYVQDNWQQLVDALAVAKDVVNDGDALEEDVQLAADALLNAILAQRFKANKDNLKGLINKAEGLDLSKYTKESVAAFKAALRTAEAIMADETLSTDEQPKVDKTAEELKATMDGLKLASDDGNVSGDGDKDKNKNDGIQGKNNETSSDGDKENGKDAPKTSDNLNVEVWLMLMIVVALTAGVSVRRRRR